MVDTVNKKDVRMTSSNNKHSPYSYRSEKKPTWCAGCGGYGVLNALYKAISNLQIEPENLVIVSGIGCSSRLPEFVKAYGFHTIHGRLLPIATGVKLSRPELKVLAIGGDGDGLAIGGNHFLHAARRNVDITYVMIDNSVFGMTKGQPSPTSDLGLISKASPYGVMEQPVNPAALAIAFGATFVARGFSGKPKELGPLIVQAMQHKGFAFVHVLSPCVTFLDEYEYWLSKTEPIEPHQIDDKVETFKLASASDKVRLGLILKRDEETINEKFETLSKSMGEKKLDIEDFLAKYVV